jgi:hypothetical protein
MAACSASSLSRPLTNLGSATATDYDIVNVELADGRDYPIYIGAGFSDEEGQFNTLVGAEMISSF